MDMKSKKYYSDLQEKRIASYLGWKQVSGSGSRPAHPGDVLSDAWLGECKTHIAPNSKIVFNFAVWDKIADEAASQFKLPVLFCDDGSQELANTVCMIDVSDQLDINEYDADYSDKACISFSLSDFESVIIFNRKAKIYCIMSLEMFKNYTEFD